MFYDNAQGGGDGSLISSTEYVSTGTIIDPAPDDRVTDYGFDWRDRQLWTLVDDHTLGSNSLTRETYTFNTFDNLDDVTDVTRYYDLTDTLPDNRQTSPKTLQRAPESAGRPAANATILRSSSAACPRRLRGPTSGRTFRRTSARCVLRCLNHRGGVAGRGCL